MDLIYMNASMIDQGVMLEYDMDLAFGKDENSFECKVSSNNHCCQPGYYLYIDGTEYGGIVDSIESVTGNKEVIYSGRTWHGILNSKVLQPDIGADYLVCSGEANAVIGALLTRIGLTDLFAASSVDSGIVINGYQINRYIAAYDGIRKMLDTVAAKLLFTFSNGKVVLSAKSKRCLTDDEHFDNDLIDLDMTKKYKTTNHLVCLGQGDLKDRTVVHLYADPEGNISQTQSQFGMDEIMDVYDFPSVESAEELINKGTEKLKKAWNQDVLKTDFDDNSNSYDVGDIVGAFDNITGISVSSEITKKIITINSGITKIQYKVGE